MKKLYSNCRVQQSPFTKDINGRDGEKLLEYLETNKDTISIPYLILYLHLKTIQDYACARQLTNQEVDDMKESIRVFFDEFDKEISQITKTHLLRFHVHQFVSSHRGWGLFTEQGKLSLS